MDKVSMDALNEGWALGFGTSIAPRDDDLGLLAADRAEMGRPPADAPDGRPGFVAGAMLRAFLTALMLRAAH